MSLTTTVFCKTASSTSSAPHCWRSHRKKYLASLAKLKSALSIEPDICPKAERVCNSNDLSCCFIIRDIDGGSAAIFSFGTNQAPGLSIWQNQQTLTYACPSDAVYHTAMLYLCNFWRQSHEPAGAQLSRTTAPSLQSQLPLSLFYPPTVQ